MSFRCNRRSIGFLLTVASCFGSASTAVAQQPPNRSSYYWHPSLSLQNVSTEQLVKWLGRVGVNLPFSVAGNVSFNLKAGVPLTAVNDPQAYELDGYLSSNRLAIQNIPVEDFAVTVRYRNGVMILQAVRFRLPKKAGEKEAPSLSGQGSIALAPAGDLDLVIDVQNFNLARLSEFIGVDLQLTGNASGRLNAHVVNAQFSNSANWSGDATLQAAEVRTPGLYAPKADAFFRLADKSVTFEKFAGVVNDVPLGLTGGISLSDDANAVLLKDVRLEVFGGAVVVRGKAPIGAPTAQDLSIEATNLDLALLDRTLRPLAKRFGTDSIPGLGGRISFAFDGTVPFQNLSDYSLWRLRRTEVQSAQVQLGTVALENVRLAASFDGTRFSLGPFGWDWPATASTDGRPGRIEARVAAQLNLLGRVDLRIQSTHTPVQTILAGTGFGDDFEGFLNGSFSIGAPALALKTNPSSLSTWAAELDLNGEALRMFGAPIEFRRLQAQWRSPTFEVKRFDVALAESPIQATGRVDLAADHSQLNIARAELATEFGKAAATGSIPLNADREGLLSLRIENGDATTLTRIVGADVFSGNGPLNGQLNVTLSPAKDRPRLLGLLGNLTGVLAGKIQANIPVDAVQNAASAFASAQATVDVLATVPVTILGRNVTDAAVRADWHAGVLDVVKIGAIVNGIKFGGKGRATLNADVLVVDGVELDLLGGKARGELRYPRRDAGTGSARFTIEAIDLAAAKPFTSPRTPKLSGRIDANGQIAFAAAPAPNGRHPAVVTADVAAPKISIGHWRINRASAKVRTAAGLASINVRGETLDGLAEWNGVEVLPHGSLKSDDGAALASRGTLTIRNIHLGRLAAAAPRRQISEDIVSGRMNAVFHYTRKPDKLPTGTGTVEVLELANTTGLLSERLESAVTFDGERLRLPNVEGDLLDGTVRGLVSLNTLDMRNGAFFRGEVSGMSLPRFFPQIGADADLFTGEADIQIRGRISNRITGAGTIEVSRGTFVGLDVSSWRSPAEIEVNLADYSGRFTIPQTSALLAQGQLRGNVDYRWESTGVINSTLDFTNVNLRGLVRSSSRLQTFGEGRITGRLQLGGRSIRGLNDLSGAFNARLENTQPGSLPVFAQTLSLLTGVGGRALVFDRGTIDGVIGGGAARLNRLELVSQRARISGNGAIRFGGGLDLDLTAFTGKTSVRGRGGEFLAGQLLVAVNPSAAILLRINQLLSDRVIAVKVTGTFSAPVTRVKPGPTLTAEAARFLLEGYIPTPAGTTTTR